MRFTKRYSADYSLVRGFVARFNVGNAVEDEDGLTADMPAGRLVAIKEEKNPNSGRWRCYARIQGFHDARSSPLADLESIRRNAINTPIWTVDLAPRPCEWRLALDFSWAFKKRLPWLSMAIQGYQQEEHRWVQEWWDFPDWTEESDEVCRAAHKVMRGEFPSIPFLDWLQERDWPATKKPEWAATMREIFKS